MHSLAELINQAKRAEEVRFLLRQGKIEQEEADHRIGNAMQVVLFARAGMDVNIRKIHRMGYSADVHSVRFARRFSTSRQLD